MQPRTTPPSASSSTSTRRSPARTAAAALALFALAGVAAAVSSAGCSTTPTAPPFCEGGFVRQQPTASSPGVCEGKCSASACNTAAGTTDAGTGAGSNTCVDNHCVLQCASNLDCTPLTQDCVAAKEDGTSAAINVCQDNNKGSIGVACPFGTECNTQYACPNGDACEPSCTGSSCACAAAQCLPLTCLTVGTGDADAYCTMLDCHEDSDCPGGFFCETSRSSHYACGTTPSTGQQELCGYKFTCKTGGAACDPTCTGSSCACSAATCEDKTPCADPSMDMATGTTFAQGTACLVRNECHVREECTPCKTDIDCTSAWSSGMHCTMVGTETVCTQDCATDGDCDGGFKCSSGACVPRFGACVGTGNFCDPCRNDLDCGPVGSNKVCESFGGQERMCLDATALLDPSKAKTCTVNTDCPKSPSGLYGQCANETLGVMSGDALYDTCFYPPFNSGEGSLSCWCANPGKGCYTNSDCCTKKCMNPDAANMVPGTCG
jgi:hypothetical protein